MKLECYSLSARPPDLVPAPAARAWMDAFPDRHAYRCLPLAIANTHGWEVLSPCSFEAIWTGGLAMQDVTFRALDDYPWLNHFVVSNFTRGIVTFHTGYLFRTEPGWNLLATGPFNRPRDGIVPLTGVIETDWLPYPFTMNWHFTRPGIARWEKGEPICTLFPVMQGALETVQPEIFNIEDNPELNEEYRAWGEKRTEFMKKFLRGDSETLKQAWQRYYFLGKMASTGEQIPTHSSKIRLNTPVDKRGTRPQLASFPAETRSVSQLGMQEALAAKSEANDV